MAFAVVDDLSVALLKLGGMQMPGVIPKGGISGWARTTEYEVAKGKGSDGATLTDKGENPPKGKVKLVMWTNAQLAHWDLCYAMLRAARAAKTALDLGQPIINQLEVTSVVVEEIGMLTEESTGLWSVELSLMQWLPSPKPAGGKPAGSKADAAGAPPGPGAGPPGTVQEQQTAAEKEFEEKLEEALK